MHCLSLNVGFVLRDLGASEVKHGGKLEAWGTSVLVPLHGLIMFTCHVKTVDGLRQTPCLTTIFALLVTQRSLSRDIYGATETLQKPAKEKGPETQIVFSMFMCGVAVCF